MNSRLISRPELFIILLLCGVTIAVYWPVTGCDFINFDDPHYVTGNDFVRTGLSWENIKRAFTTSHSGNWHPLTWISHMIDCQLFGLKAGAHHFTNLLIHLANTVLLFVVLRNATGIEWRSGIVAALFALHPLHVESVAWISERKDVLSTFFGLLAIFFYVRYANRKDVKGRLWSVDYVTALVFFACSLMSKGMFVTLPFVLLLMDFWPLKRVACDEWHVTGNRLSDLKLKFSNFASLVAEKFPFFILSLVSSVITFATQQGEGAVRGVTEYPVSFRMANVAISYARYLGKTFWPTDLAIFYPLPAGWPAWQTGAAVALLLSVSIVAFYLVRRAPHLFTGWFWFLGTLVPVIGFVQVGEQAMADRYTYIPLMGLFIAVVWSVGDIAQKSRLPKPAMKVAAVASLGVCACLTSLQLRHWKTSESLFARAVAVTENNYLAENHLSTELLTQERLAEAETHLRKAVTLRPQFFQAQMNLGTVLARQGKFDEAEKHFREAIRISPGESGPRYNLGNVLKAQGKSTEAADAYESALRSNPDDADAHSNLALILAAGSNMIEAATHFAEAVRLKPADADAHYNLATALAQLSKTDEAMQHYEIALTLRPAFPQAHFQLGVLLTRAGDKQSATAHFSEALRLKPDFAEAQQELALLNQK